jgi:predicted ATP-binding protein involved in virulence
MPKQGIGASSKNEKLFYVPAQRVLTMSQGWPRSFGSYDIGDPYVIKQFSESVRVLMEKEGGNKTNIDEQIFPKSNRIKEPLRKIIDDSIFHGSKITSDNSSLKKRFLLNTGQSKIPFMAWSAGQKEFMPLLLSLYYLMPSAKVKTRNDVSYVIIEEPEMGLHPDAIQALLVVFLELVARKYKLIISTHSPVLLEMMWCINYLQKYKGSTSYMFELFGLTKSPAMEETFKIAINNSKFKTYYFDNTESQKVVVKDISSLDAGSEDLSIANWGGLTNFSSLASEIVSKIVSNG